jgi:cell division protein FtsA
MAGDTVENVMVSLSGTHLVSHSVSVELSISGEGVSEQDIADILREGCASVTDRDRSVIHCFATQYHLDGARGIRDPRHMFGSVLGADLHIITADNTRLKNLAGCIARCHLNVAEFVVAPHAAALGCLEQDEREMGVILIDVGGAETGFSVFSGGANLYTAVVPVGGAHVTGDVAKGLSTSLAHAERLKNLHGSAIAAPQDSQSMISVPQLGEEDDQFDENSVPRSVLIGIIRPRLEEILELIRDRLDISGIEHRQIRNVVLTGGGSQLLGMRDLASSLLGRQVRLGKPRLIPGLADSVSGPSFTVAVGMLQFAANRPLEDRMFDKRRRTSGIASRTERFIAWIKDNL